MFGPCFVILGGKRESIALLKLFSWCFVGLQFVIVVYPDYTSLLFGPREIYKCGIILTYLSQKTIIDLFMLNRIPCFIIWTNPCFVFKVCG